MKSSLWHACVNCLWKLGPSSILGPGLFYFNHIQFLNYNSIQKLDCFQVQFCHNYDVNNFDTNYFSLFLYYKIR